MTSTIIEIEPREAALTRLRKLMANSADEHIVLHSAKAILDATQNEANIDAAVRRSST